MGSKSTQHGKKQRQADGYKFGDTHAALLALFAFDRKVRDALVHHDVRQAADQAMAQRLPIGAFAERQWTAIVENRAVEMGV